MIRQASSQDFEFIFRLYMHPQSNIFLLYEPMPPDEFLPIFNDLLEKKIKYVFEHDGAPVGMFKLIPATHRNAHVAFVGGLAIDPAQAGRGHGFAMMSALKEYCRQRGFLRIELSVDMGNVPAYNLYKKSGFEEEGLLKKYVYLRSRREYVDGIMMACLL